MRVTASGASVPIIDCQISGESVSKVDEPFISQSSLLAMGLAKREEMATTDSGEPLLDIL